MTEPAPGGIISAGNYTLATTKGEIGMLQRGAASTDTKAAPSLLGGEILKLHNEGGKLTLAVRFDTRDVATYARAMEQEHRDILEAHRAMMWPEKQDGGEKSPKRAKPSVEMKSPWDAEKNVMSVRVFPKSATNGEKGAHVWIGSDRTVGSVRDLKPGKKVMLQLHIAGLWHRKEEFVCGIHALLAHAWVDPPACSLFPFHMAEGEQLAKGAHLMAENRIPPPLSQFAPPDTIALNTGGTATYNVAWLREPLSFLAEGRVALVREDRIKMQLDGTLPVEALDDMSTRLLAQLRAALPEQFQNVPELRALYAVEEGGHALWVNVGSRRKPAIHWSRGEADTWSVQSSPDLKLENAQLRAVVEIEAIWVHKEGTSAGFRTRISHFQKVDKGMEPSSATAAFPFDLRAGLSMADGVRDQPLDDALPPMDATQYRVDNSAKGRYTSLWHKTGIQMRVTGEVVREMQGRLCVRLSTEEDIARLERIDGAQHDALRELAEKLPVSPQPLMSLVDAGQVYPKLDMERAPPHFWRTTTDNPKMVVPTTLETLLPLEGRRLQAVLEVRGMWLAHEGESAGRCGHNVILRHAWCDDGIELDPRAEPSMESTASASSAAAFPPGFSM